MLPFDLITCLRNASNARLSRISLPNSKQNLAILGLLLRHGFVSSVNYGSATQPEPEAFRAAPVSQRRIWATMKFRDQRPVLGDIQLISKPSKRIQVSNEELLRLLSGKRAQFVKPADMGEVILLKHSDAEGAHPEWIDGREALQRGIGGELVLRVK